MRKFPWLAPALILAAFLLAPAVARADSYHINIQLGDGSIVGTVTTNGASGGANGYIEIDSYSFDIVSGQVTGTSSGDRSGSAASINEINVEDDLTADGAHIYFNFSSGDSGYVAFQTILPNGALQYVCLGARVTLHPLGPRRRCGHQPERRRRYRFPGRDGQSNHRHRHPLPRAACQRPPADWGALHVHVRPSQVLPDFLQCPVPGIACRLRRLSLLSFCPVPEKTN